MPVPNALSGITDMSNSAEDQGCCFLTGPVRTADGDWSRKLTLQQYIARFDGSSIDAVFTPVGPSGNYSSLASYCYLDLGDSQLVCMSDAPCGLGHQLARLCL